MLPRSAAHELIEVALECFEQGEVEQCEKLLRALIAVDVAPAAVMAVYAVCLSELGEGEHARAILEAIVEEKPDGPAAQPFEALLELAQRQLPGGAYAPEKLDRLKSDAERWLPRASPKKE